MSRNKKAKKNFFLANKASFHSFNRKRANLGQLRKQNKKRKNNLGKQALPKRITCIEYSSLLKFNLLEQHACVVLICYFCFFVKIELSKDVSISSCFRLLLNVKNFNIVNLKFLSAFSVISFIFSLLSLILPP